MCVGAYEGRGIGVPWRCSCSGCESHLIWVLGTVLGPFARTIHAVKLSGNLIHAVLLSQAVEEPGILKILSWFLRHPMRAAIVLPFYK